MRGVIVLFVIGVLSLGTAEAEKVRTNQSTKVYSRAGEQATVLLKVESGQNMTLLEQEGRWLKVRVKGRTGYVPRSKVDMADEEDIVRNTRRRPFVDGRSKKRGAGQEEGPEDRIGADAVGQGQEEEPKAKKAASKGEDEEEPKAKKSKKADVEDEEEPKAKKKAKEEEPKKKAKKSEDEEEPKKKAKKSEDEEEPKKKAKKSEDEEEPKKKAKEEEPKKKKKVEEEEPVVDDEKTAEPEEDKRATAHVTKKIAVYDQPTTKSEELFMVRPADVLYPIEEKGKWTYVENSEGDSGWVPSDELETEKAAEEEEGGGDEGPKRRRDIEIGAAMGVMFITQGMRTSGTGAVGTVPDNYNIPVQAGTLSLQGGVMMPVGKKYLLGGDITYDYAKTFFGGVSYDTDGPMGPNAPVITKITIHNINVRVAGGYDFGKKSGMAVFARLGYRYQGYLVDDYADPAKNPAKLPQEVVQAPTIGLAFGLPRLTNKIGLHFALDTILFGASVKQTAGLEDGGKPTTLAAVLGVGFTYKLNKMFELAAAYDLRYMHIDFGPPVMTSERGHMGSNVQRTDIFHLFTFGIAKPF